MLEHAREAVELTRGRTRADLDSDRVYSLAVARLVEIVGEAARRVSTATRDAHPEIPWRQIAGTRDRLIHAYDIIDPEILWSVLQDDLPDLIRRLEQVVPSE